MLAEGVQLVRGGAIDGQKQKAARLQLSGVDRRRALTSNAKQYRQQRYVNP